MCIIAGCQCSSEGRTSKIIWAVQTILYELTKKLGTHLGELQSREIAVEKRGEYDQNILEFLKELIKMTKYCTCIGLKRAGLVQPHLVFKRIRDVIIHINAFIH